MFKSDEGSMIIWVNNIHHLTVIQNLDNTSDILGMFDRMARALNHIESHCPYAYDNHYGYVTTEPMFIGTAMRIDIHVKLPKLSTMDRDKITEIQTKHSCSHRFIVNEENPLDEHVYQFTNVSRIGKSERQMMQDVFNCIRELFDAENSLHYT